MKIKSHKTQSYRRANGNTIAEFGPALMILLLFFFFPMLDLLALAIDYGLVQVLNTNQAHEASLVPSDQANAQGGAVKKGVVDVWLSGMGKFVKMQGYPTTQVFYRHGETDESKVLDKYVLVRTVVICTPFLPLPLPMVNVPGINGPMTFTLQAERHMENPDFAP